jgi:hypothetical protein
MREDQQQFMRVLGQLPARLTAEQAAWVLNCQPHDMPILVAARLLKPLGNPSPYNVKFFAASELLEQVQDRAWLAKVTNALNQHWQKRNANKKNRLVNGSHKLPNCSSADNDKERHFSCVNIPKLVESSLP